MKTTIAALVVLLVLSGSAGAVTLEVTGGAFFVPLWPIAGGDVGFDFLGAGLAEVGPGAYAGPAYGFSGTTASTFFTLGNLFGAPPRPQYVEMFFTEGVIDLSTIAHAGDSLSMGFTMVGEIGSIDFNDGPLYLHRQKQADLIGHGILTITTGALIISTVDGGQHEECCVWDFTYRFPEPSSLILTGCGIVSLAFILRRRRR
jgi:hypothetical protein